MRDYILSCCGDYDPMEWYEQRTVTERGGDAWTEIEFESPAGEDVVMSVCHDGTPEGYKKALKALAEGYDPDEHAEMWLPMRGERGVPSSLRDLMGDAEDIGDMLKTFAEMV